MLNKHVFKWNATKIYKWKLYMTTRESWCSCGFFSRVLLLLLLPFFRNAEQKTRIDFLVPENHKLFGAFSLLQYSRMFFIAQFLLPDAFNIIMCSLVLFTCFPVYKSYDVWIHICWHYVFVVNVSTDKRMLCMENVHKLRYSSFLYSLSWQ